MRVCALYVSRTTRTLHPLIGSDAHSAAYQHHHQFEKSYLQQRFLSNACYTLHLKQLAVINGVTLI
jgi:hypothetical protein